MPKIVDHDERRRHIVEALWRVVDRDGVTAVSVRTVAAEAGMPKSSIGHYVGTMPQFLTLAVRELEQSNTDHILALGLFDLDVDKVTEILYTLVPVSDRRRQMSGVWLVLAVHSTTDPDLAAVLHDLNNHMTDGLFDLVRGMSHQGLLHPQREPEREARRLHALIDGLSLQSMTDAALRDPVAIRQALRDEVLCLGLPVSAPVGAP
ncbi:MAG: TetR/AcrR family transcriptional regulator [bacterium]